MPGADYVLTVEMAVRVGGFDNSRLERLGKRTPDRLTAMEARRVSGS
jgi:hypothetical protein